MHVVNLLKLLARQGRTIVCTIHQPSASLFQLFDLVRGTFCRRFFFVQFIRCLCWIIVWMSAFWSYLLCFIQDVVFYVLYAWLSTSFLFSYLWSQVYVLANGECLFHGATTQLVSYLENVKLPCPVYYNPADYGMSDV